MKKYTYLILSLLAVFSFFSCDDMLNVNPEEVIKSDDYLGKDKEDARSALFGVLAQMQDYGKQYVILGEAQADLTSTTINSDDNLRQLQDHTVTAGNPYASVSTLYSIINNCNIALHGIDSSTNAGSISNRAGLKPEYFAILRVRTWAFLQVAINYGKVPYITEPVSSTADLSRQYPLLSFDQALDSLINHLVPLMLTPEVSYAGTSSVGVTVGSLIPDKNYLLGELYLWKGDYENAALSYKSILDNGSTTRFKLPYSISFSGTQITPAPAEIINQVAYYDIYKQHNLLYDLFITNYQLKPSAKSISNWNLSKTSNTSTGRDTSDARCFSSWTALSGNVYIAKSITNITLVHASNVHLRLAEAINRAGFPLHALAILNSGMRTDTARNHAHFEGNAQPYLNFTQTEYAPTNAGSRGVRGRYNILPVSVDPGISHEDSIAAVEKLILNEDALEYAFEGLRWQDLLRIARRTNDATIIADAVAKKFEMENKSGQAVKSRLMDPANWYLPLPATVNFLPVQ